MTIKLVGNNKGPVKKTKTAPRMLRRSTAPTESPSLRHGVVFDEGANFSLEPVREPDTPSLDGPTSSREASSPSLTAYVSDQTRA